MISKKVKAPIQKEPLLLETDFGNWEGLDKTALQSKSGWQTYVKDPFHFKFPQGESPQEVKKRTLTFKQNLLNKSDWRNVIVVSHYTPTVFLILSVMGNGDASRAPFKIDNASLTVIERVHDFEYIRMMNYSP
jgi:alpha-ribazole phosphatase